MNKFLLNKLRSLSEGELYNALFRDHLTGVLNRQAFNEVATPAVALVDMDSLKYINDTYGHREGDLYLRSIAEELLNVFGDAHVFRIAGDEFAVTGLSSGSLVRGLLRVRERFEGISFGVGRDLAEADNFLQREKHHRENVGLRAARGETPPWLMEQRKVN